MRQASVVSCWIPAPGHRATWRKLRRGRPETERGRIVTTWRDVLTFVAKFYKVFPAPTEMLLQWNVA